MARNQARRLKSARFSRYLPIAYVSTSRLPQTCGPRASLAHMLGDATRRILERVLPTAVFLNFAVYILYSEAAKSPLAATVALALVAGIAVATRLGLILTALLGSACYYLLQSWFVG